MEWLAACHLSATGDGRTLAGHFGVADLSAFGCEGLPPRSALGAPADRRPIQGLDALCPYRSSSSISW